MHLPLNILVVDDRPESVLFLTEFLLSRRHRVESTASGAEAVQTVVSRRAAGDPYHLVLTDLRMPEMDGIALARELLRRGPQPEVAIVSAYLGGNATVLEEARLLGVVDILGKPLDLGRVDALLEGVAARAAAYPRHATSRHVAGSRTPSEGSATVRHATARRRTTGGDPPPVSVRVPRPEPTPPGEPASRRSRTPRSEPSPRGETSPRGEPAPRHEPAPRGGSSPRPDPSDDIATFSPGETPSFAAILRRPSNNDPLMLTSIPVPSPAADKPATQVALPDLSPLTSRVVTPIVPTAPIIRPPLPPRSQPPPTPVPIPPPTPMPVTTATQSRRPGPAAPAGADAPPSPDPRRDSGVSAPPPAPIAQVQTSRIRRSVSGAQNVLPPAPATASVDAKDRGRMVACAHCHQAFMVAKKGQVYNVICVKCGGLNRIDPL